MLRAIQLMGWPLDMICSVDIWATETIPAELPPMVKFKDEYDQKVLDWFGVPVTRLCAVKRERERERGCPTNQCSTPSASPKSGKSISTDSQLCAEDGASGLKTQQAEGKRSRLTYEDIFYRTISPKRERERERSIAAASAGREETSESTDGLFRTEHGAIPISNERRCRVPKSCLPMVLRRTQKGGIYGFPISPKGNWCTQLKTLSERAPERGAENKYRSLLRDSGRRTFTNQEAPSKA